MAGPYGPHRLDPTERNELMVRRPAGFAGFTLIWLGQMLSALGTRMTNFALSIWVWDVTGRATDLTLMLAFSFVPTVLLSPIAGVLIDRWSRRLTVVLSDVGSAVATGALLVVFLFGPAEMWQVYLVNAVTGAFLAFQLPAYSSTITLMVERGRYPRANAMMFLVRFGPVVIAPALAAALLTGGGIRFVLAVDALSYVAAIGTVFGVNIPPTPRVDGESPIGFWRDSLSGFRYLLDRRPLAGFEAILFAINLFASIGFVLLVPLVLARSGNDTAQAGIVATIGATGGAVGAVLLGVLRPTARKMPRILLSILVFSVVGRIVYGVGEVLALWVVAMFFVHLCIPFIDGYAQSIWQEKVEPAMQGRVFAARQFIEDLTVPIGAVVAGPAVDQIFEPWMRSGGDGAAAFGWLVGTGPGAGMGLVFVIVGVLGVMVAVLGYAAPGIRHLESVLPDADIPDITRPAEPPAPAVKPAPVKPAPAEPPAPAAQPAPVTAAAGGRAQTTPTGPS